MSFLYMNTILSTGLLQRHLEWLIGLLCRKFRANIKIKGTKIALGAYHNEIDAAKVFLWSFFNHLFLRQRNWQLVCLSWSRCPSAPMPWSAYLQCSWQTVKIFSTQAFDRAAIRYRGAKAEVNFPRSCPGLGHSCQSKKKELPKDPNLGLKSGPEVCRPYTRGEPCTALRADKWSKQLCMRVSWSGLSPFICVWVRGMCSSFEVCP